MDSLLITIALAGDVLLGNILTNQIPPDSGRILFTHVTQHIARADLAACNLEGAFAINWHPRKKQFRFLMPTETIHALLYAGFDLISLANNHIWDGGEKAAYATDSLLLANNITPAGLTKTGCRTRKLLKGSQEILIGFCAFSVYRYTANMLDDQAIRLIDSFAKTVDILIVSMHAGAEGASAQHVTGKTEYFLGENRGNPQAFARAAIDAGADIVFGHGPHVLRGIEVYKNRIIAYSLGNFACWYGFNLKYPNNISAILLVTVNKEGKLLQARIIPIELHPPGIPKPDPSGKAIRLIKELSIRDGLASQHNFKGELILPSPN